MPETAAATPHLTLEIKTSGSIATVRCHGKLVYGVTDILVANVQALIPECTRIILDLTDLTYMDSMGLGTLMRLYVSSSSSGCTLELVNIGQRVKELLQLTHIWEIFSSVGEHGIRF